jgi:hypothetical protein
LEVLPPGLGSDWVQACLETRPRPPRRHSEARPSAAAQDPDSEQRHLRRAYSAPRSLVRSGKPPAPPYLEPAAAARGSERLLAARCLAAAVRSLPVHSLSQRHSAPASLVRAHRSPHCSVALSPDRSLGAGHRKVNPHHLAVLLAGPVRRRLRLVLLVVRRLPPALGAHRCSVHPRCPRLGVCNLLCSVAVAEGRELLVLALAVARQCPDSRWVVGLVDRAAAVLTSLAVASKAVFLRQGYRRAQAADPELALG